MRNFPRWFRHLLFLVSIFLAQSCTSTGRWSFESSHLFDLSRMTFSSADPIDGIQFEILFVEGEIAAYLTPLWSQEGKNEVLALFQFHKEQLQHPLSIRPGRIRLKLPQNLTAKIIESLQEGLSVVIIIDGREQLIPAEQFCNFFHRMAEGKSYLFKSRGL